MSMTPDERHDFQWSLRPKSLPQLKKIFNELKERSKDPHLSNSELNKTSEKAAIVNSIIKLRKLGGAQG